jgi:hypothetical protein
LGALLSSSYYDIEKDTTSTKVYEKHRLKNTQAIGIGVGKRFLSNPSSLKVIKYKYYSSFFYFITS